MRFDGIRKKAVGLGMLSVLTLGFFTGCNRSSTDTGKAGDGEGLTPLVFQSDWFAQPEYAGFYQALATGLYKKNGLDVTILEGGPNTDPMKRLVVKRCDLMNIRSDDAIVAYARGMPVRFIGVTMQQNPQGILSHGENAITDFRQLDGRRVMVDVAAPWVSFLERKYGIAIERMPHNFGLSHFLNDKTFLMQCFVTNEPYFVRQQGAEPHVLPIWESGLTTYRGILVHADSWEQKRPALEAFVRATHEAWHDYLYGDPAPAHRLIAERNSSMTPELMDFIRNSMLEYGIIDGRPNDPANIGRLERVVVQNNLDLLFDLGVIDKKFDISGLFPTLRASNSN
jgi:NitT/TauT family transport system substrate-binding protein